MLAGLDASTRVNVDLWACSEQCNINVVDHGGGWSESRTVGLFNQQHDLWVDDNSLAGDELMTVMIHEIVHAAVNAGKVADTGISCGRQESRDACTERWTEVIRREIGIPEKDKAEKGGGGGG